VRNLHVRFERSSRCERDLGQATPVAAVAAVTIFGVLAVSFMMVMYTLEARHAGFVLAFMVGCLLSSVYGFLSGAWPFGVVEIIWAGVAFRRYQALRADGFVKRSWAAFCFGGQSESA
jgi:hypothetical protein